MKTYLQSYKSILPPLLCASVFAVASWVIFMLTGPSPDKAAAHRLNKLKALQEENHTRLSSYGWIDRAKGWVRIPIERAMELEVLRLRALTPSPAAADSSIFLVESPQ